MNKIEEQIKCIYRLYQEYENGTSKHKKDIEHMIHKYFNDVDIKKFLFLFQQILFAKRQVKMKGGSWPKVPRDSSAVSKTGTFWDIPKHLSGVVINIGATVVDSGKLLKSALTLPRDFSTILGRPNEPIPSGSSASKFLDQYLQM